jgi:hypothetical protein
VHHPVLTQLAWSKFEEDSMPSIPIFEILQDSVTTHYLTNSTCMSRVRFKKIDDIQYNHANYCIPLNVQTMLG